MAIPLIGPDGREYEISDPAKVAEAEKLGYRVVTPETPATLGEQVRGFGAEAKDVIEVGSHGLLQGATAGLFGAMEGSALNSKTGEYPQREADMADVAQRQKKLIEAHPIAHGVGEFTGMVVSPINKVGAAVRGGVAATTALGRIGSTALGAGAEGMLYGAGNTLSDAALGDYDLTAEKMVAGVGLGGVLGLAGGGLGAGIGEGFKSIVPKVGRAIAGAKGPLDDFAEDRWLKAGGAIKSHIKNIPEAERSAVANVIRESMAPGGKLLPGTLDDAAAVVAVEREVVAKQLLKQVGVDDAGGLLPKMSQEEAQAAITKSLEANGARVGDVLKKADAMGATPSYSAALGRFDAFEQGLNLAEKDLVQKELGQVRKYLTEMGSQPVGPNNSFSALNSIKSTIQKDTNFMADGSAKFGLKRQIAGILRDEIDTQLEVQLAQKVTPEIAGALGKSGPNVGAELFQEFKAAKQAFGALANAEKALGRKTSTGADAIRALVEGASLAEPSLAGKLSALDHATTILKHGMDQKLGNNAVSLTDYMTGLTAGVMTGNPLGALGGIATAVGHKILRERGSAVMAKLADSISRSPRMQLAAQSFGSQLQTAAPQLGKYSAPLLQAFAQSPARGLAMHMVQAQADPDYAEVAEAAGFLPETAEENAHATAKGDALAGMAEQMDAQNQEIEKGLKSVMKGEKPPKESKVMSSQDFGAKRMRRDGPASHSKRVEEIRELAANPQALLERITGNTTGMSENAPGVVSAMTRTAHAAVAYLARESQEPPKAGPLAHAWVPNESERHVFAQKLEAVEQPMSVLRHAAAGTLVPEQWRAVQTVYPLLARQIADMALERMADPPKDVPYRARLMLSIITGVDPDGTLGQSVALNQAAIEATASRASNDGAAGGKPDSKLTLGNRAATPSQKREQEMSDG